MQLGELSSIAASAAARSARRPLGGGRQLDLGAMRRGEVVDELRLLLEVRQLLVVELVAPCRQGVELVHQRLRLARRDHRPQLALQALPMAGELGAGLLGLLDGVVELALAGDQRRRSGAVVRASSAAAASAAARSARLARRWASWSVAVSMRWSSSRSSVSTQRSGSRAGRC